MLPELRDIKEIGAELLPHWDEARRKRWIYRAVEEKGMPAVKLGRSLLFDPAAVAAWLAAHMTTNGGHDGNKNDGPPQEDGPLDT